MRRHSVFVIALVLLAVTAVGVFLFMDNNSTADPADVTPTVQCPVATPELFQVDPVTSPTTADTQMISVYLGLAESITISSEAGSVTVPAAGYPTEVEIPLQAGTTHNLTVEGSVQTVTQSNGCTYGGYTLSTTTDRNGDPLVIEHE